MPYCIKRLDCKEFKPERCEENGSYECFLEREQSHPTYETKEGIMFLPIIVVKEYVICFFGAIVIIAMALITEYFKR